MGLRGEWWIDEDGNETFADGDIMDTNHEGIAFWAALGLDPDEVEFDFVPGDILTAKQVKALRDAGANEKAIEFFKDGTGDSREYMLVNYAWIRVANQAFQLWDLDDNALGRIRDFVAGEYSNNDEDPLSDTFEIEEAKKGGMHLSLSGADLLESGKSAAALKYSARRERPEWHNPGMQPAWLEDFVEGGGRLTPDGKRAVVFHATTRARATRMVAEGVMRAPLDAPDRYGVYVSSSPRVAQDYGDGTLVGLEVRLSDLMLDDSFPDGRMDFSILTKRQAYRPARMWLL